MRVASPARECVEIDGVTGRRYNFRNGMADVHPRDAKAIVQYGGFVPSALGVTARRHLGFRCEDCGFGSFFKTCSRCGGQGVREV